MIPQIFSRSITLPAGATGLSNIISLDGLFALVGIIVPSNWTTADIAFQVSVEPPVHLPNMSGAGEPAPSTFYPVYDETGQIVVAQVGNVSSAARMVAITQAPMIAGTHFKFKSVVVGTPATAVNQTTDKTLIAIFRTQ